MTKGPEGLGSVDDFTQQLGLDTEGSPLEERKATVLTEYTQVLAATRRSTAIELGMTLEQLHNAGPGDLQVEDPLSGVV